MSQSLKYSSMDSAVVWLQSIPVSPTLLYPAAFLILLAYPSMQDTVPGQHLDYNTISSIYFLRYSFIDHAERKAEQLGGLRSECLGQDSNPGF